MLVRTIGADRVRYGCDAPLCMCSRRHTAELGVRSYVENLEEICSLDLTRDELATICCHIPGRIYGL